MVVLLLTAVERLVERLQKRFVLEELLHQKALDLFAVRFVQQLIAQLTDRAVWL